MEKPALPEFTSRLSRGQLLAVLLWLPVHVLGFPWLMTALPAAARLTEAEMNFIVYAAGTLFMLLACGRFLRREFDQLCDHPGTVLLQICLCYAAMLAFNLAIAGLLSLLLGGEELANPNNAAVLDIAHQDYGKVSAMAIFLAPILEEMIFRAGIFGSLRHRSRLLAYLVGMLAFSVYHVWGFALSDPSLWFYVLQYLPVSYLLCRCYERTNTIWGSIFFHMLVNAVSIRALTMLEELL